MLLRAIGKFPSLDLLLRPAQYTDALAGFGTAQPGTLTKAEFVQFYGARQAQTFMALGRTTCWSKKSRTLRKSRRTRTLGSENAAPGDEERRIKALEAELAESINDRCPKTMEEVDEVISSIYDALGDGGEGPLSKDDALFALGMSPPPTLYYAIEVLPGLKSLTRVQGRYEEAFKEIGDGSPRLSRAEFLHFAKRCVVAMTTDETYD
jgi:hypothetical protein